MRDDRSKYIIKLAAAQRYLMWYQLSSAFDHIRIAEFPKSGGTWLGQMVGAMAAIPFPRNTWMSLSKGVQHSHLPGPIGDRKTILLVRDGRDVIVSAYYHFIIGHDRSPSFLITKWRERLQADDIHDVTGNLSRFIDLFFTHYTVGGSQVNWAQHVDSFNLSSPSLLLVRYEDLLIDAGAEIERIAEFYNINCTHDRLASIVKEYSFEAQTQREAGDEREASFLRKGIAGDWKNKFDESAQDTFNKWALPQLQKLGYETTESPS